MALQSSGSIAINQIAAEFGGDVPHGINEYYRNGGRVPANNTNVPESGTIQLDDFYGAVNEIVHTQSSSTTNMQLSSTFGSNWGSSVPKRLIINSGVTVGATGSYALRINGSMGGSLVIQNYGSIQGQGGSANGGNGGNAIQADQTSNVTIINESGGQIYAGGGGGGKGGNGGTGGRGGNGGTGGGGYYTGTVNAHGGWDAYCSNAGGGFNGSNPGHPCCAKSCKERHGYNHNWYCAGSCYYQDYEGYAQCNGPCRRNYNINTNGGSGGSGGNGGGGGSGGNGGRGRGYNQSRHDGSGGSGGSGGAYGSGGSGGGTNAGAGGSGGRGGTGGTGGTGGNGGDWGQNGGNGASGNTGATGATGNAGANGNRTGGSGGASGQGGSGGSGGSGGGSRGTYITNRGSLSFTNNGSVAGA